MIRVQQELQVHCRWKLGRPAETSVCSVIVRRDSTKRAVEYVSRDYVARLVGAPDEPQLSQHCGRGAGHLIGLRTERFRDTSEDARKARHVIAVARRKISSAIERHAFRR